MDAAVKAVEAMMSQSDCEERVCIGAMDFCPGGYLQGQLYIRTHSRRGLPNIRQAQRQRVSDLTEVQRRKSGERGCLSHAAGRPSL
eukprot:5646851-Amphidinium_carterae.1